MKIKTTMIALVLAATPLAGVPLSAALAEEDPAPAEQTAEAAPTFTLQRAYFGTREDGAGSSLAGLVRSLDRARDNGAVRRVSYADNRWAFHGNSLQRLLWQQDWRVRVSRELKALLD